MKVNENIGLKGVHKVTLARLSSPHAVKLHGDLLALRAELAPMAIDKARRDPGAYKRLVANFRARLAEFNQEFGIFTKVIENVTPTEGRVVMARALAGDLTDISEIEINYTAVGTSATAPAITDSQLGTETFRKLITASTYVDNLAYITGLYAAGEATGTLQEHGLFINGTGTANSGAMISRLLLGGIVKGGSDVFTVESELTISDV